MGPQQYNSVGTSFFGKGSISLLPEELRKRGFKRALIVTDQFLYDTGVADKVGKEVLKADMEYAIYYEVKPNPTVEVINDCIEAAKLLQVDVLIAVGGGSAIDTAKAVSIVLANGGSVEQYEGEGKSKKPGIPIVAVNTTAGTGSEVTCFYIVTDMKRHTKMCMIDTNCMVSIAINDADFMLSMPKGLTAATGMDAMTHAIEAVLTRKATPITDKDAIWAITTIKDYLPKAVENGNDAEAREMMAYAEYVAGMAFSNSGLGMVHAMAHSLGGYYNLPHGICNAVLLPYVMEYNGKVSGLQERFQRIAVALGINQAEKLSKEKAVDACVSSIRNISAKVGISGKIEKIKPTEKDYETIANLAMKDACMAANYVQPSVQDVVRVYKKIF